MLCDFFRTAVRMSPLQEWAILQRVDWFLWLSEPWRKTKLWRGLWVMQCWGMRQLCRRATRNLFDMHRLFCFYKRRRVCPGPWSRRIRMQCRRVLVLCFRRSWYLLKMFRLFRFSNQRSVHLSRRLQDTGRSRFARRWGQLERLPSEFWLDCFLFLLSASWGKWSMIERRP